MNHQPLSGMHQSELTYEGLFTEYERRAEELFVGGAMAGDDFLKLMNESQEVYESARVTTLGVGPSHFDMNSNATGSTSGTFNGTWQLEQNEGSLPFSYDAPHLGLQFAQPRASWGDAVYHSEQNSMNPQVDLIDGVHYSHFLDMAFIDGGSISSSEHVHSTGTSTHGNIPDYNYLAGGDYEQSTSGQGFAFDENDRGEIPVLGQSGPIMIPNAYQEITAPAEEPVFSEDEHWGARSTVDLGTSVSTASSESAPSGELADPPYPDIGVLSEQFLMGSAFDFEFNFNFPLETNDEAAVYPPNIPQEHNVTAAGAEYEAQCDKAGGSGYAQQDGGRNDYNDDKENDSVNSILVGAVFPDHLEGTVPLEPSRATNIAASNGTNISASTGTNTSASKEKQPASNNAHLEQGTAVVENNGDELDTAAGLPAEIEISKPSEASNVGSSKQKKIGKRDATTAKEVSVKQKNADTLNISKDREAPRKKVRISKDQAIEGKNSGILTCDICLASSVKHSVYTFNRRADLNCHIRVVHEKAKQLTCPHPDCVGKTFSKLSSLKRHKEKFGH